MEPIDFHGIRKKYNESQWVPPTVWLPAFFKISYFMFNRRKSKLWRIFQLNQVFR